MRYSYEDTFLRKKVDDGELEAIESKALAEASKLNIVDELYKERFVKALVYVEIAKRHIEAEGMEKKMRVYQDELDRALKLAKTNSISNISTIALARG